jgi:hypothetical protein
MALQLVIGVRCDSADAALTLKELLAADTRPLFDEDVEPDYQAEYTSICNVDYPDSIESIGNDLWVQWIDNEEVKGVSFDLVMGLFQSSRFDLIAAHEVPDDPMICGDEAGWFWLPGDTGFEQISRAGLKIKAPAAYTVLAQYWDL